MSTATSPAPAAEADVTHRAAADKFFAATPPASDEPMNDPAPAPAPAPAASTPPAAPASATPAPAAPAPSDPLASVLKSAQKAAPASAPSAPAEPPALEDIDKGLQAPPENAKSRAGWDELKKRASEERRQRLELEQKLKAAPAVSPVDEATKARLAELETQNKSYSERLKLLDLRSHPEFVSKFVQPAEQAKLAMATIAKTDEVEVNVEELVSMKGKALNTAVSQVMETMTPYARVKFQAALDSFFTAQAGAEQAVAQADETLKSMKQNGGARSRASFDSVARNYSDAFLAAPIDDKLPDADKQAAAAYNAALAGIGKQAETYAFGQIDETGVADLSHKAALYEFTMNHGIPRIASLYGAALNARDAKIAELETQVKALTKSSPTLSGGSGAGAPGDGAPPANESHAEAARRYFQR
jgi:hypothetical protein